MALCTVVEILVGGRNESKVEHFKTTTTILVFGARHQKLVLFILTFSELRLQEGYLSGIISFMVSIKVFNRRFFRDKGGTNKIIYGS